MKVIYTILLTPIWFLLFALTRAFPVLPNMLTHKILDNRNRVINFIHGTLSVILCTYVLCTRTPKQLKYLMATSALRKNRSMISSSCSRYPSSSTILASAFTTRHWGIAWLFSTTSWVFVFRAGSSLVESQGTTPYTATYSSNCHTLSITRRTFYPTSTWSTPKLTRPLRPYSYVSTIELRLLPHQSKCPFGSSNDNILPKSKNKLYNNSDYDSLCCIFPGHDQGHIRSHGEE